MTMEILFSLNGVTEASSIPIERVIQMVFVQCSSRGAQLGSELCHAEILASK